MPTTNIYIYMCMFVCVIHLIYLHCNNIIVYLFRKLFIHFMESINLLYKKLLNISSENMDMASTNLNFPDLVPVFILIIVHLSR